MQTVENIWGPSIRMIAKPKKTSIIYNRVIATANCGRHRCPLVYIVTTAVQRSRVQHTRGPHHHVFRRFYPVTECPEPEHPPDDQELEPHDEQDCVHEERQNPRSEAAGVSVEVEAHRKKKTKKRRDKREGGQEVGQARGAEGKRYSTASPFGYLCWGLPLNKYRYSCAPASTRGQQVLAKPGGGGGEPESSYSRVIPLCRSG